MKSFILTISSLLIINFIIKGQISNKPLQLTNPVPPSPQAAAFAKYGEIPVSLNSGIPSISIPIYNISAGKIGVPVNFSYHAGGIKVEELASNVGLGWSLNAGGSIVRETRGIPDESNSGYYNTSGDVNAFLNNTLNSTQRQAFLSNLRTGLVDGERDMFTYSLPGGLSGKFFQDDGGNYVTMPKSNLKITGGINGGWTILDDNGTKYIFHTCDITSSISQTSSSSTGAGPSSGFNDGNESFGPSAWYVDSIMDVNNETILLSYNSNTIGFPFTDNFTKKILTTASSISYAFGYFSIPTEMNSSALTINSVTSNRIKKIDWKSGKIEFNYSNTNRLDLNNDYALSSIIISNYLGSQVKKFNVLTSYFISPANTFRPDDPTLQYRLKLDAVQEIGTDGSVLPPFKFAYSSVTIPDRFSNSQDNWGYFNGKANGNSVLTYYQNVLGVRKKFGANRDIDPSFTQMGMLTSIFYPTGGKTEFKFENNHFHEAKDPFYTYDGTPIVGISGNNSGGATDQYYFQYSNNFTVDSAMATQNNQAAFQVHSSGGCENSNNNPCSVYIQITGPNGYTSNNPADESVLFLAPGNYTVTGTIETEYAHTPYAAVTFSLNAGTYNSAGIYDGLIGGLRIKQITSYDNTGNIVGTKQYDYTSDFGNYSSGVASYKGGRPDYSHLETYYNATAQTLGDGSETRVYHTDVYESFSAVSNLPLMTSAGGYVTYGKVTETESSPDGKTNGKTEYYFTTYDDAQDIVSDAFPYPTPCTFDWMRGLPTGEIYYQRMTDGSYQRLKEKIYKYTFLHNDAEPTKTIIRNLKGSVLTFYEPAVYATDVLNSGLAIATINTVSEFYWLQSDTTIIYFNNQRALSTFNVYNYRTNPFQIIDKISQDSKGHLLKHAFTYPYDYLSTAPYSAMIARHELSPIIQTADFNGSTSMTEINTNFQSFGDNSIQPSGIQQKTLSNPSEFRIMFNSYNGYGHILEQQKANDVKEAFLWGYNTTYPVAKITNTTSAIAQATITQSILDNPTDDAALRNHLNNLRNIPGALVTTYTYTPLVGITSETDPSGKTTFYEYDSFNRLKNIKDYQGNIVKNFQYNYVNSCGSGCVVLPMQTFNGSNTIGYPVGVFNVNAQLLGQATNQNQYVNLWNADPDNLAKGTLTPGINPLHFNLTAAANQTPPSSLYGLRFYQFDLDYSQMDDINLQNGEFIDFGDGTVVRLGSLFNGNGLPANTVIAQPEPYLRLIHNYPNSNLKTLTLYHNDASEVPFFGNMNIPSTCTSKMKNLRGNFPQFVYRIGGNGSLESTWNSVAGILNWNNISSVTDFLPHNGDLVTPCSNMNYAQDFMANNKGLKYIGTSIYGYYRTGYRDLSFKISRLKSDWNSYFTKLETLQINEDHWNHEDLSGLINLKDFRLTATTQNHLDDVNSPLIPISAQVLDNAIIQIANGAGTAGVKNGVIRFYTGGSTTTPSSGPAITQLKNAGWHIYLNDSAQ